MRFTVEKSMFKTVAVVVAISAVVAVMQLRLWQARASGEQAAAATMSSFIHDLHFSGYPQHLPILVVENPI